MEAKLKTLKVADLKEVCTQANVPTTTRSTKADLISKILASQPAIDAYNAKYQQNTNTTPSSKPASFDHDDLLPPPEEVDWTLEEPSPPVPALATASKPSKANATTKPAPAPAKPQSKAPPQEATPSASEPSKTAVPAPPAQVDEELEKRKARAARFGIALVEPTKSKTKAVPAPATVPKATKAADDPGKIRARAERFGFSKPEQTGATTISVVGNKKRGAAVVEEVGLDEQERRRKRAERFGIPSAVCSQLVCP
ncbi:hypothetical protein BJV74DRAFT_845709 [Russula compacta]|nr:hypothetical protein BJV74DRAFT_845709 [Russula compacta]